MRDYVLLPDDKVWVLLQHATHYKDARVLGLYVDRSGAEKARKRERSRTGEVPYLSVLQMRLKGLRRLCSLDV